MGGHIYTVNPQAMHETIDAETIVIDLATGTYYSLRGSGPVIWNALGAGASREAVIDALVERYEGGRDEIGASADEFLSTLETERLITRNDGVGDPATPARDSNGDRSPFEAPVLEKYEDMQDIILLDPVHMVDDQGWPNPAAGGSGA